MESVSRVDTKKVNGLFTNNCPDSSVTFLTPFAQRTSGLKVEWLVPSLLARCYAMVLSIALFGQNHSRVRIQHDKASAFQYDPDIPGGAIEEERGNAQQINAQEVVGKALLVQGYRSGLLWLIGLFALQSSCEWFGPPTIVITAEEFRFTPTRIEWEPYHPFRLLIRNQGRERHVFHSPELFGPEAAVTWHGPMVALQEANAIVLDPGQSIELYFALSPGLYPFRCWIKGHGGMEGTILVKENSSG